MNSRSFGQIIPASKILVFAPHADDEVLGCGGTIIRYTNVSALIRVVYLTHEGSAKDLTHSERYDEAKKLTSILPNLEQRFYHCEDSTIVANQPYIKDAIKDEILDHKPEIIFAPWFIDTHLDHYFTAQLLAEALISTNFHCHVACYEIFYPLFSNYFVNITNEIDLKNTLIDQYASQIDTYNIKQISNNLNRFRGSLYRRKSFKYVESFFQCFSLDLLSIMQTNSILEYKRK